MGRRKSENQYKLLSCVCPDEKCKATLYFPSYAKSIECTSCGQRHERTALRNIAEVTNPSVALHNVLKNILLNNVKPKKGADNVKVLGLSNYVCKLLSPILSTHGMDKQTGKAKLLTDMSRDEIFDCSILGDHAFMIEEENLDVVGYGRDRTGSIQYLADTLNAIKDVNEQDERLVPLHADGDGHCLVHAVSRALVGRELFWHALRMNLTDHFKRNISSYKEMFKDFIDVDEWDDIVNECDPNFVPYDDEPLGLRNIHIFGLANVLRRPIILLDSMSGMQSLGDYTGAFLPGLCDTDKCCGKNGALHKPLCIAWSSSGRNHYIPLVGVKGKPLPQLPRYMIPKAWGLPDSCIDKYMTFDANGFCVICGDRCLGDRYIQRLVSAMEEVFTDSYGVNPSLVADFHQCIYKSSGFVGVKPETTIRATQKSIEENRLYRCLTCDALTEYQLPTEWFIRGGSLYNLAVQSHGPLSSDKQYSFPLQGAVCSYDKNNDVLMPDMKKSKLSKCSFCQGDHVRLIKGNGIVSYINCDRTLTRSVNSRCTCGFKHYWDGKEYDNLPEIFPISLEWNGKVVAEKVVWFQYESDVTMNSNVFEVAQKLVQKHFPGEFGSERLVQRVVDTILRQTAKPVDEKDKACEATGVSMDDAWSPDSPSKIILSGEQKKSVHKEELNKSKAEKDVRKRIEENAPKLQRRKSAESTPTSSPRESTKISPRRGVENDNFDSNRKIFVPSSHIIIPGEVEIPQELVDTCHQAESNKTTPTSNSSVILSEHCRRLELEPDMGDPANHLIDCASEDSIPEQDGEVTSVATSSVGKRVRLATSDGRQVMLNLPDDVKYSELQMLINEAVQVPPDKQKIKVGFPPKELKPPAAEEENASLSISHGDKIMLEILPDVYSEHQSQSAHSDTSVFQPKKETMSSSWGTFEHDSHNHTADKLLESLKDVKSTGDSIDTSIASLALMAALTGKDLWTYVQAMPHLFSVGGLFYKQVERDLSLVDGKHCTLPALTGKVFRYNAHDDRLDLCCEPHGHFAVEPDIERKAVEIAKKKALIASTEAKFGTSGAVGQKSSKAQAAFSGQGHSLRSSSMERMPNDLIDEHTRLTARRAWSLSDPFKHQDSIAEEEDAEADGDKTPEEKESDLCTTYQRLGPGVSIVNPSATNSANQHMDMIRSLAHTIQRTLDEPDEHVDTLETITEDSEENTDKTDGNITTEDSVFSSQDSSMIKSSENSMDDIESDISQNCMSKAPDDHMDTT